ncbi:MAG: hypothetical protein WB503_22515, partial [Pseudolabrys sp.]
MSAGTSAKLAIVTPPQKSCAQKWQPFPDQRNSVADLTQVVHYMTVAGRKPPNHVNRRATVAHRETSGEGEQRKNECGRSGVPAMINITWRLNKAPQRLR